MKTRKKIFTRIISTMLVIIMTISALPLIVNSAPASDLPDEMIDNSIIRALAYTGYNVRKQKKDGTLYQPGSYGSNTPSGVLSDISYGTSCSGKETVKDNSTATGKAPDIELFEKNGLCCASFVTYFLCNYLPNIEGSDTEFITNAIANTGMNSQAVVTWQTALEKLADKEKITKVGTSPSNVNRKKLSPGDVIIFGNSENSHAHIGIYSGTYNNHDFVIHVGNDRGPEIMPVDALSAPSNGSKASTPNAYYHMPEEIFLSDGAIEVYKVDTKGKALSGAVFIATNDETDEAFEIGPTNKKGYAKSKDPIPYGTYTVKETIFPENYRSYDKKKWTVTVDADNDGLVTIDAINEEIPGSVKIIKTSEDGIVEGINFIVSGNNFSKQVTTGSDGTIKIDDLAPGKYTIKEIVDDKYEPQEEHSVTVVSDKVATVTFDNKLKRGSLKVKKTAEDGLVEGLQFRLTGTSLSGVPVEMYEKTNADGIAQFNDIPISGQHPYTIEEVGTPNRYVVPIQKHVNISWGEVAEVPFENILKKWRAKVNKVDYELSNSLDRKTQGDAQLSGAVYGVYRGTELIDKYTTDENGYFVTKHYPCGDNWTIREITPSKGYLLDSTVYSVGAKAENFSIEHNDISLKVYENVIKGNISIIKHTDDGSTQIETPELDAKFEIFLKNAGSYTNANVSERDVIVCNEHGFGQTKMLPYGVYTVHQVSGWDGRELMKDFDVSITQHGATYRYLINNRNFESYVRIVKIDAETKKTIQYAGAAFKIYKPNGELVTMNYTYPTPATIDTFYTDANGALVTPEKLPFGKGYYLVEVSAPYGYVLDNTPVFFDITEDNSSTENKVTVVKIEKPNMAQKGIITIHKTGEGFTDVSMTQTDNNLKIYQPIFSETALQGAVFEIYAKEDVMTLDGTIRYKKGEVVDTIKTNKDGIAKSKKLYLGKYDVKEVKAPYGMTLNNETHSVELIYAGQTVSITETSTSFYDNRQKACVSLKKELETNELFDIGTNGEIKNVLFGLYVADNLVSTSGTAIPSDGLIELITFDSTGLAKIKTDLPLGKYYVKELSTDEHYILSSDKYEFAFEYQGDNTDFVNIDINNGKPIKNEMVYGSISGKKVDENNNNLEGAVIGLFKPDETEFKTDNALMITTSIKDGSFYFSNVPYGKWIVREIQQPNGYVLNETLFEVFIGTNHQTVEIEIVNNHIRGSISLTKIDADYPDNKLSGATFEVYKDNNANGKLDNLDEKIGIMNETTVGTYELNDLLYGHYLVKETVAPEGFYLDKNVYSIFVEEHGKTYFVENKAGVGFINNAMKGNLKIVKTSSDGKVEGFSFRITGPNGYDIVLKTDKNGEILVKGLHIGKYTVSEVSNKQSKPYTLPKDKVATVMTNSTTIVKMHNVITDIPKTGDENNLVIWLVILGVTLVGFGVTILINKKKKK